VTTVTDVDGNVYHTVTIGSQVWMVENLKTTKYNDGTQIPLVTGDSAWAASTTPAYCWYQNNNGFKNTYGALYNAFVIQTGKLAPAGWRIPTFNDFNGLITFLGGSNVAGCKLNEAGNSHWEQYDGVTATNSSGFTAIGGGYRDIYVSPQYNQYFAPFSSMGEDCFFWGAFDQTSQVFASMSLSYNGCDADAGTVQQGNGSEYVYRQGWSVRCIKN
jgi:uncharacterized protein (TIGR02145 family)